MPRTIKVSLRDITKAIEQANKELGAARNKTKNTRVKDKLSTKIERLKAIEGRVKLLCPPTAESQATHFVIIPLE